MNFPTTRLRRLRSNATIRKMISETDVKVEDLIMPYFVVPGENVKNPINSMPGNYQLSIDLLVEEVKELVSLGVKSILLFGVPEEKDQTGEVAAHDDAIIPKAIRALKKEVEEVYPLGDIIDRS